MRPIKTQGGQTVARRFISPEELKTAEALVAEKGEV
jgi:hypothetical protein